MVYIVCFNCCDLNVHVRMETMVWHQESWLATLPCTHGATHIHGGLTNHSSWSQTVISSYIVFHWLRPCSGPDEVHNYEGDLKLEELHIQVMWEVIWNTGNTDKCFRGTSTPLQSCEVWSTNSWSNGYAQRAHDPIITSSLRQHDVGDVVLT